MTNVVLDDAGQRMMTNGALQKVILRWKTEGGTRMRAHITQTSVGGVDGVVVGGGGAALIGVEGGEETDRKEGKEGGVELMTSHGGSRSRNTQRKQKQQQQRANASGRGSAMDASGADAPPLTAVIDAAVIDDDDDTKDDDAASAADAEREALRKEEDALRKDEEALCREEEEARRRKGKNCRKNEEKQADQAPLLEWQTVSAPTTGRRVQRTAMLSDAFAGHVIGRRGANIKEIRLRSGASVIIPDGVSISPKRTTMRAVTVIGSSEQCREAERMIANFIRAGVSTFIRFGVTGNAAVGDDATAGGAAEKPRGGAQRSVGTDEERLTGLWAADARRKQREEDKEEQLKQLEELEATAVAESAEQAKLTEEAKLEAQRVKNAASNRNGRGDVGNEGKEGNEGTEGNEGNAGLVSEMQRVEEWETRKAEEMLRHSRVLERIQEKRDHLEAEMARIVHELDLEATAERVENSAHARTMAVIDGRWVKDGGNEDDGGGSGGGAPPPRNTLARMSERESDTRRSERVGRNGHTGYYKLNASAYMLPPAVTAKFKEMEDAGFFRSGYNPRSGILSHNLEELVRSKAWYELSRVTPEQGVEVLTNLNRVNLVRV